MGCTFKTAVPADAVAVCEVPRTKPLPTPTGKNVLKSGRLKLLPDPPKVVPITPNKAENVLVDIDDPSHKSQSFNPLMVWVVGVVLDAYIITLPVSNPNLFS
jgi:hypothetical protein